MVYKWNESKTGFELAVAEYGREVMPDISEFQCMNLMLLFIVLFDY